jgi:hypothetical protein
MIPDRLPQISGRMLSRHEGRKLGNGAVDQQMNQGVAVGYIDDLYSPQRRHSFVDNISPLDFELRFMQQAA